MVTPAPDPADARPTAGELAGAAGEMRFRRLFEGVPIGMFRSTPAGQFLEVNAALAAFMGYPDPETMVAEVNRVGIPEALFEVPGQRLHMMNHLRGLAGEWHVEEVRYRKRDGTFLDVILSICLQVDPATGQEQLFGFVQDITERQRKERERRHRDQLMAVGMLASGVAHDFNNMIGGIQAYAQLMIEEEDPAEMLALARRLHKITVRANDLSYSLLRFARQGGDRPEKFPAYEGVRNALNLFLTGRGRSLEVREELPGEGPVILGYPSQFQNAVLNLCLNAKDAMEGRPGSLLTVAAECRQLDAAALAPFSPGPLAPGPFLLLEVADNGPGMDPDVRSRCLEPFYSTKGELGTGLGLPSVQGAMVDHGGGLRIITAPGEGCRVQLVVPTA